MEAFQSFFSVQEGLNVFFIAGILSGALEKGRLEHNVKILPGFAAALIDGMYRPGKNHQEIFGAESI